MRALVAGLVVWWSAAACWAGPPNIVLIVSDDQMWTDFGFMGHPTIQTPHLDRLAAEGAVFERGYVPTSLCRPSLASIITGLYPHQHGITGNDPPKGSARAEMLKHIERARTLPRLLAKAGYRSFQAGKWWEGPYQLGGFTEGMSHGDPQRGGRHGDEGLKIGREGLGPVFEFIERCGEQPFFLWYAPMMPHTPHKPPAALLEKYASADRPVEVTRYYAMCEWFDATCGELLAFLDERGVRDNTLVVFVTDNGWIQRTPQTPVDEGWNYPFAPKSKQSPYDGGLRTPIILHWPGKIAPARYQTLASSLDLAPTILRAAGIEPPKKMTGQDLVSIAAAQGASERNALFGEIFEHDVADIDNPAAGLRFRWCVEEEWKLILPADPARPAELYHLADDPHETVNLAAEQPETVERLRGLIDAWWTPEAAPH